MFSTRANATPACPNETEIQNAAGEFGSSSVGGMTRQCAENGCNREARWRQGDDGPLSWCKHHAPSGTKEHAGLNCVGANCDERATYAATTLERPQWCVACKERDSVLSSVDVAAEIAGKYCKHPGCLRVRKLTAAGCCPRHTTAGGLFGAVTKVGPRQKLPEHMQRTEERRQVVIDRREERRREKHECWVSERAAQVEAEDPRNAPGYHPMHTVFPDEWQGLRSGHGLDLKFLPPGELPLAIRKREEKALSRKRKRDEQERRQESWPFVPKLRAGRGEVVHSAVADLRDTQYAAVAHLRKELQQRDGKGLRPHKRALPSAEPRSTGPCPSVGEKSWRRRDPELLCCVPVEPDAEDKQGRECRAGRTQWTSFSRCCGVVSHLSEGKVGEVHCDRFATYAWPGPGAPRGELRFCWRHGPPPAAPRKTGRDRPVCSHPACKNWARCGKPRQWCAKHAPEGEKDGKTQSCKKCNKRPSFAMEIGQPPAWCGKCAPDGAKNVVRAQCDTAGCTKRARVSADVPQPAHWCPDCAPEGAVDAQVNTCQWVDKTGARSCTEDATHYPKVDCFGGSLDVIFCDAASSSSSSHASGWHADCNAFHSPLGPYEVLQRFQAQTQDARFCEAHCKEMAKAETWDKVFAEGIVAARPVCHSPGCAKVASKCEDEHVTKRLKWCEVCAVTAGFAGPRAGAGYAG